MAFTVSQFVALFIHKTLLNSIPHINVIQQQYSLSFYRQSIATYKYQDTLARTLTYTRSSLNKFHKSQLFHNNPFKIFRRKFIGLLFAFVLTEAWNRIERRPMCVRVCVCIVAITLCVYLIELFEINGYTSVGYVCILIFTQIQ